MSPEDFQDLIVRHNIMKKKDRKMEALIWVEALKNLCKEKGVDFSIYK